MKKKILSLLFALFLLSPLVAKATALDEAQTQLGTLGTEAQISTTRTPIQMIAGIIRVFLGLLGIIFVILMIYAGFLWMTAGGAEEKVTKAKKMITQAVIGIIIVIVAYSISSFVLSKLIAASTGTGF